MSLEKISWSSIFSDIPFVVFLKHVPRVVALCSLHNNLLEQTPICLETKKCFGKINLFVICRLISLYFAKFFFLFLYPLSVSVARDVK